jgi:hypothetical protein
VPGSEQFIITLLSTTRYSAFSLMVQTLTIRGSETAKKPKSKGEKSEDSDKQ